jgi:nitrile hydratase
MLATGSPVDRPATRPALFGIGEIVRARIMNPSTHTRLPRYVRGREGRIERIHGVHVYPDSHAHGRGEDPRWLYSVSFEARDLWGDQARRGDTVSLDLWEPYLDRA